MLFFKRAVLVCVHLDNRFFKTLKAGFKILEFILALGVESVPLLVLISDFQSDCLVHL